MLPRPRPIPLVRLARAAVPTLLGALAIVAGVAAIGCGGPNRWGYARTYVPTAAEESAVAGAKQFDPVMAELKPEEWRGQKVQFFMIVDDRKDGANGAVYLTGKMHVRSEVNGCANKYDEDTCRVTVKPGEGSVLHVATTLAADDRDGPLRLSRLSLVHVVGTVRPKTDDGDGKQVIDATFYRQWPFHYYEFEGELLQ